MKYFLSICTAIAILGCGTNHDYDSEDGGAPSTDTTASTETTDTTDTTDTTTQSYTEKGGLTGIVYFNNTIDTSTSKVCFDVNTNGVCDAGEASESVYDGGKYSFEKSISDAHDGEVLLSAVKSGDTTDYLTSYANNITPYTTLVVNEVLYNPNANASIDTAKTLLSERFDADLLNGTMPTDDESKTLYLTLQSAISKGTNVYDSIASAVDSIYKQDTLSPTVSITSQTRASELSGTTLTLDATDKSITWEKTDEEETIMGSSANENNIISYSRWHNSLRVVDIASQSLNDSGRFLDVDGARYATDASTGASEQLLKKVVEDDSNNIFALITEKDDKTAGALGVYKSNVTSGITDIKYSQVSEGANFYALDDGTDLAVSGSILVVGSDNGLKTFATSSLASPTHESDAGSVKAVSASENYIFAGIYKRKANTLSVYDTSLNAVASLNTNDLTSSTVTSLYPDKIASYGDRVYFTLNDDDLGKTIYCYEVSGGGLKAVKQISLGDTVVKLSVSEDGNYLVATTWDKKLQVFQTSDFANTSVNLENISYGAFLSGDTVAVSYKDSFGFYSLTKSSSSLSDADKETWTSEHR